MRLGWTGEENLTETNKFLSVVLKKKKQVEFWAVVIMPVAVLLFTRGKWRNVDV